jgi:carbamoyl-phosphate synthase small subunit
MAGIDTRAADHSLCAEGCPERLPAGRRIDIDPEQALADARDCEPMSGRDLASTVTTESSHRVERRHLDLWPAASSAVAVVFTWSATTSVSRRNILRLLADAGCRITVVPANWPVSESAGH